MPEVGKLVHRQSVYRRWLPDWPIGVYNNAHTLIHPHSLTRSLTHLSSLTSAHLTCSRQSTPDNLVRFLKVVCLSLAYKIEESACSARALLPSLLVRSSLKPLHRPLKSPQIALK